MSPASLFRSALALALLAAGCAHAPRTETLGRAENGILYLDGNELVAPFVFKTDGWWLLVDAWHWQQGSAMSVRDLVLGDSVGFVPPDSNRLTARPNDVAMVIDRVLYRGDLAGIPKADRLEMAVRTALEYTNAVDSGRVEGKQGILYFRGHHDAHVFEVGSVAEDSAQAAALGLPLLSRGQLLTENAKWYISILDRGSTMVKGNGYVLPPWGRTSAEIAAKADSLRRGGEEAWPSEYDWARDDIRSPRPLAKRMKGMNRGFRQPNIR